MQRNVGLTEMGIGFALMFFTGGYGVLPGADLMADGAIVFSEALLGEKVCPISHFANDFVSPAANIPETSIDYVSPFPY